MGSNKNRDSQAQDDETPQHIVDVAEFYIGKYPVTNAEYAAFVAATRASLLIIGAATTRRTRSWIIR